MWLINTGTFELERWDNYKKGSYAILSHTWGDDEVSFQEIRELESARKKRGFAKIECTVLMARARNLKFAWVDTCCIDKTSSAELSEAINSMYKWYEDSGVCFAYLSDMPAQSKIQHQISRTDSDAMVTKLKACRWFTRGWTLQELIAPENVEFYDSGWNYVGDKVALKEEIGEITNIPRRIIGRERRRNGLYFHPHDELVAYRMSWASSRETTRVEDMAYCLLGIFGITMPLLYGEGDKAFTRLQEEICKHDTDLSLFAWKAKPAPPSEGPQFRGLLANHPREFSDDYSDIHVGSDIPYFGELTITNRGIRFDMMHLWLSPENGILMDLGCERSGPSTDWAMLQNICLTRVSGGFARCNPSVLVEVQSYPVGCRNKTFILPRFWIRQHLSLWDTISIKEQKLLHVEFQGTIEIFTVWPLDSWDPHRSAFVHDPDRLGEYVVYITAEESRSSLGSFIVLYEWFYGNCIILDYRDPEFEALVGLVQQRDPVSSLTVHCPDVVDRLLEESDEIMDAECSRNSHSICSGEKYIVSAISSPIGRLDGRLQINIRNSNEMEIDTKDSNEMEIDWE